MLCDVKVAAGVDISQCLSEDRGVVGEVNSSVACLFDLGEILGCSHEATQQLGLRVLVSEHSSLGNGRRIVIARANQRERDTSPVGPWNGLACALNFSRDVWD